MCSSFGARVWDPMWWPMCSVAALLEAEPFVVVVGVLCSGFALLDESVALVSLD